MENKNIPDKEKEAKRVEEMHEKIEQLLEELRKDDRERIPSFEEFMKARNKREFGSNVSRRKDLVFTDAEKTYMRKHGIDNYIKEVMKNDTTIYIGSSAGSMIAGSDIMLAKDFESNFVRMYDYSALSLFEGTILPHTSRDKFKSYLALADKHVVERYPVIYSVSNKEVLVLDLERI